MLGHVDRVPAITGKPTIVVALGMPAQCPALVELPALRVDHDVRERFAACKVDLEPPGAAVIVLGAFDLAILDEHPAEGAPDQLPFLEPYLGGETRRNIGDAAMAVGRPEPAVPAGFVLAHQQDALRDFLAAQRVEES